MDNQWMQWAQRIQAISKTGIAFSKDIYDIERYEELRNISVEIIAKHTDLEIAKIKDLYADAKGYQTPKVDIRGVVFRNGRILMVKEKNDNKWALPGGFCDVGLSPSQNVVKEIKEESGFIVNPIRLLALLDKNKHPHPADLQHFYKIFILCEIVGGEATTGIETNSIEFFSENDLPELSITRNTASQIHMLFEFLHNPDKETVFD